MTDEQAQNVLDYEYAIAEKFAREWFERIEKKLCIYTTPEQTHLFHFVFNDESKYFYIAKWGRYGNADAFAAHRSILHVWKPEIQYFDCKKIIFAIGSIAVEVDEEFKRNTYPVLFYSLNGFVEILHRVEKHLVENPMRFGCEILDELKSVDGVTICKKD